MNVRNNAIVWPGASFYVSYCENPLHMYLLGVQIKKIGMF